MKKTFHRPWWSSSTRQSTFHFFPSARHPAKLYRRHQNTRKFPHQLERLQHFSCANKIRSRRRFFPFCLSLVSRKITINHPLVSTEIQMMRQKVATSDCDTADIGFNLPLHDGSSPEESPTRGKKAKKFHWMEIFTLALFNRRWNYGSVLSIKTRSSRNDLLMLL